MNKDSKYYFVGTTIEGEDKISEFLNDSVWKFGYEKDRSNSKYKKLLDKYNKIKVGDYLIAKSVYTQRKNLPFLNPDSKTISAMKIKALGIVKENILDGHTLKVDWIRSFVDESPKRVVYHYPYQSTISSAITYNTNKKTDDLLNFITNDIPIVYDDLKSNSLSVLKNDSLDVIEEDDSYENILLLSSNIILHGSPGTGKTYLAKQIAMKVVNNSEEFGAEDDTDEYIEFVQFHPNYDYSDFVEGLRPILRNNQQVGFELMPGIFTEFCDKARNDSNKNYVFIIDEINRGEISKIFGELFFSIDPGYRGKDGAVTTQYHNLHKQSSYPFNPTFYVPSNVYIIGTMNNIDRSVENIDFAMRRRFRFVEVLYDDRLSMLDSLNLKEEAIERMHSLNKCIEEHSYLGRDYQIGPSYFLKLEEVDDDFDMLWLHYIEPQIKEYLRGIVDEENSIEKMKSEYDLNGNKENETER